MSVDKSRRACLPVGRREARPPRQARHDYERSGKRLPPSPSASLLRTTDRPTVTTSLFGPGSNRGRSDNPHPQGGSHEPVDHPADRARGPLPPRRRRRRAQADALADIKAAGTINVGVFADFPPFSSASADMSLKGYDIDVAQAIADALKVKLNLVAVTGQNRIPYLTEHRVDLLMSVGYSEERDQGHRLRRRLRALLHRGDRPGRPQGRRQGRPRRQVDRRQPRHARGHLADRGRAGVAPTSSASTTTTP